VNPSVSGFPILQVGATGIEEAEEEDTAYISSTQY
jgi:hypothetical protein